MTHHAMVTIAAEIAVDQIDATAARIASLGNPARPEIAERLSKLQGEDGLHFMSLHAFHPVDAPRPFGHIVLEFSADGEDDAALGRIANAIGPELASIFAAARDWTDGDVRAYLAAHVVKSGFGWNRLAGLPFAGTPGMSVGRIRREALLAARLRELALGQTESGIPALRRLQLIRDEIGKNGKLDWALGTPEALPVAPTNTPLQTVGPLLRSFLRTYLWPLALPAVLVLIYGLHLGWRESGALWPADASLPGKFWAVAAGVWTALRWALGALLAFAVPLLIIAGALYASLRRKEATDWTSDLAPERKTLKAILANENQGEQNHMVSITVLKPGLTRKVTIRLAFWIIGQLAGILFKPGRLGEIETIHFARWVQLPGTRDLLFFSNYGGSWESYLEDFITRAHNGLTGVWSNTVGFPRSKNLFQDGATDGERFKRYARHSMVPTAFWFSAYPELTTAHIRTNAVLRRGLAVAMTEQEAALWLAQFGSTERPVAKLETTEIQSIVFGGLGFKPFGALVVADLSDDIVKAKAWLAAIRPLVAFGDGRRLENPAVVTLALGPAALAKLGLPDAALQTFPPAFLDGMGDQSRLRMIGDDPSTWRDWRTGAPYDAALLVYGTQQKDVDALLVQVRAICSKHGVAIALERPLDEIPADRRERKEPFGFVDGTSQPVIRGTYRSLRNGDPLHLVEPGEFILGYPDNRANMPPTPELAALHDAGNLLPTIAPGLPAFASSTVAMPRDIGRNGSFLVIRQLEQDVGAFDAYCRAEARRLSSRITGPYSIDAHLIGAKMIGRWKDGSSLVRNPNIAYSEAGDDWQKKTQRTGSNPYGRSQIAAAPASPSRAMAKAVATSAARTSGGRMSARAEQVARRAFDAEDNDFLFGAEDPEGLRCPLGAHIRRANPRESFDPGSAEQLAISNRHRILRVGRSYTAMKGGARGLMFMCLNADIERQFEFVQQTWMRNASFHGLSCERDPLSIKPGDMASGYTIPTRDGPVGLSPMKQFVTTRGGGYFFLPGRSFMTFLSR
jgi:Dyp-type peroxidase family